MVAASGPHGLIRCRKQCRDFNRIEERHGALDVPFAGQSKNPLALQQPCRFAHGDVMEERPDRGQPGVTAARAIATGGFDMQQEVADQLGIKILDSESCRRLAPLLACEAEQKTERVAITRDRVRTRLYLRAESLSKEALEQCREW